MINTESDTTNTLPNFTRIQWRFIAARLKTRTDKEAAESIGIRPKIPTQWSNKPEINAYLLKVQQDAAKKAEQLLEAHLFEAAMVKVSALQSEDEKIRQSAATEILDRNLGKPKQRQELSGPKGSPIEITGIDFTVLT